MKINLKKKPKNVKIIEAFPGMGLIGTIATEFLVSHLKTEKIGSIEMDDIPAMVAIHDKEVMEPFSIYYNKKYNLVILHVISSHKVNAWKMSDAISKLAKDLNAKEIISIEGVASTGKASKINTYFYSNKSNKKMEKLTDPLKEGIIVGVTGALLAKEKKTLLTTLFVETHSTLPDSKAAAKAIEMLNEYMTFDVDPKPLLKRAEEFEKKLKGIVKKGQETKNLQETKQTSYFG